MRCLLLCLAACATQTAPTGPRVVANGGPDAASSGDAWAYTTPGFEVTVDEFTEIDGGWRVGDAFGARMNTIEPGDVIFSDDQPIGSSSVVHWQLGDAVTIKRFSLWLGEDNATGARSARQAILRAGSVTLADITLLDESGTQSYTDVYGQGDPSFGSIEVDETVLHPIASDTYTLEVIQNLPAGGVSGVRLKELDAYVD